MMMDNERMEGVERMVNGSFSSQETVLQVKPEV